MDLLTSQRIAVAVSSCAMDRRSACLDCVERENGERRVT